MGRTSSAMRQESVELSGRPVRKDAEVRFLSPRGELPAAGPLHTAVNAESCTMLQQRQDLAALIQTKVTLVSAAPWATNQSRRRSHCWRTSAASPARRAGAPHASILLAASRRDQESWGFVKRSAELKSRETADVRGSRWAPGALAVSPLTDEEQIPRGELTGNIRTSTSSRLCPGRSAASPCPQALAAGAGRPRPPSQFF